MATLHFYHLFFPGNNCTVVSLIVVVFFSDIGVARQTLVFAYDEGMANGEHAFIMLQLEQETFYGNVRHPHRMWLQEGVDVDRTCDYFQAMESVIVAEIQTSNVKNIKETFEDFQQEVKEQYRNPVFQNLAIVSWFAIKFAFIH